MDEFFDDEIVNMGKSFLPDPSTVDYYKQLKRREIFWNGYIDESLVEESYRILDWNREDKDIPIEQRKIIKVFINSDGGDLNSLLNFANIISLSKTPVWTIAMGKAYSAGGLLLMVGHRRFVFPDTTVLIHDGSTGSIGDTGKVLDNFEFTQKQEKRLKEFILKHTKIDSKLYEKNYRRDWYMFSDEIIKYFVADKIIEDLNEIY
jgi:ATP-dependent Clp protease protease subunit